MIRRNDKCPCGSDKKYKRCCYADRDKAVICVANITADGGGSVDVLESGDLHVIACKYDDLCKTVVPKPGSVRTQVMIMSLPRFRELVKNASRSTPSR